MQEARAELTDIEVIGRIIDHGEVNQFSHLVDCYAGYVFSIVRKHLPPEHVEETAHEAFIRCYQSLGNFSNSGSFKNWLSSIVVRTCYDFWRKSYQRHEISFSALSGDEQQTDWLERLTGETARQNFTASGRRQDSKEILDRALGKLSPADRMLLILIHVEGYSCSEAADLLGCSVANVKIRSFRAKKKLQLLLKNFITDS